MIRIDALNVLLLASAVVMTFAITARVLYPLHIPRQLVHRILRLLARRRLPTAIRRHQPRFGAPAEPSYLVIAALEAECEMTETQRTCPACGYVTPGAEDACAQCGASAQRVARLALRLLDGSSLGGWTPQKLTQAIARTLSEGERS